MIHNIVNHWWPVTQDYGLVASSLDRVVSTRKQLYLDAGLKISLEPLNAPLQDCLSRLEPLSPTPHKELYLATTFGWTAYFANGCRGSDPSLPMKQLSDAVGTMALRVRANPETARYPATILEVYDTQEDGGDEYGYRRSIAAANDGGTWVFEQHGEPFPFEETQQYSQKRKRDRFVKPMLDAYLRGLGAEPLSDCSLQSSGTAQGIIVERAAQAQHPKYTLDEAKVL